MAQIIKHRRGTAQQLKTVTLQKAELGVSTGSVAGLTTPILHVGDGANAAGHVVGRLFQGSTVPTLNSGDIGSAYNDLLFHDSATFKLVKLHTGGNQTLNLANNLANQAITGSLTVSSTLKVEGASTATSISASGEITASNILATGNIHAVGDITFDGGSSGTITLGSGADDNVVLAGDVNSNIIPNTDNTFDLGSSGQQWKDLYINGIGYMDQLGTDADPVAAYISSGEIDGVTLGAESAITSLTVSGQTDLNGNVDVDNAHFLVDASTTISLDAAGASNFTTSNGALTLAGAGGVTVTSTGGTLLLNGAGQTVDINSAGLDIDASGAIAIDGSSTLSIDSADNTNITVGGSGKTLDIDASGALTIDSATSIAIGAAQDKPIDIDSTTLDIDASDAITIDSSAGITLNGSTVTVENSIFSSNNIGVSGDSDLLTLGSGQLTVAGETETTTLDVNGVASIAGNITLDKATAQTITHTGASGNLTVSSTNGAVLVEGSTFDGNNVTIPGNLTVNGTQTIVNSTTLEIGDNIVVLNSAGAAADGGIQVLDTSGSAHTGSMLWNANSDYWYSGISGSTHYRVPQQTSNANLLQNQVLISDGNGRLTQPVTGGTVDFVDADLTSVDMIQGVDANVHIDLGTTDLIETKGNILPNTTNADDLGSSGKRFKDLFLEGNADIDGTTNIEGVLTTQATIAATAGITVTNTAATVSSDLVLNYDTNAVDRIMLHDGPTNSVDFAPAPQSTSTNGDTAGEYLQWNGSAFVMSQTIDGGSF